jgi:hypothetical protein
MAVPVTSETAVGGFVLPGDRVDVLQTRDAQAVGEGEGGGQAHHRRNRLQNVRVLALDQSTAAEKDAKTIVAATATLEVGPAEAEALTRAKAAARSPCPARLYRPGRALGSRRPFARSRRRPHQSRRPDLQHLGPPMIRRLLSASLAAALVLAPSTAVLADGPVGGTHIYRSPARAARARRDAGHGPAGRQVLRVDLTASGAQSLTLPRGKSAIVELPVDVRDMLVTNPQVADAVLRGPRRIYVLGVGQGSTDAVFFDAAGRKILSLAIRVEQDSGGSCKTPCAACCPAPDIQVQPIRDSVILTGMVANAGESSMASQIAASSSTSRKTC